MYPQANVPVLQLSIDYTKGPAYHFELAKELSALRRKGVLIMGSGNMVHNLRMVAWDRMDEPGYGYDWALNINEKFKSLIMEENYQPLFNYQSLGSDAMMAIPTPEHYMPLMYTLGLKQHGDDVSFFNDKAVAGSLTMTSVKIG
jgi:4,5-DOPA dioxygenase extradiol